MAIRVAVPVAQQLFGFSPYVAKTFVASRNVTHLARSGHVAIVAAVSSAHRARCVSPTRCSAKSRPCRQVCESRDPKGHYAQRPALVSWCCFHRIQPTRTAADGVRMRMTLNACDFNGCGHRRGGKDAVETGFALILQLVDLAAEHLRQFRVKRSPASRVENAPNPFFEKFYDPALGLKGRPTPPLRAFFAAYRLKQPVNASFLRKPIMKRVDAHGLKIAPVRSISSPRRCPSRPGFLRCVLAGVRRHHQEAAARSCSASAQLQAKIDAGIAASRSTASTAFLKEIGHLLPSRPRTKVDEENRQGPRRRHGAPGPMPATRLNAANARWGSLYDAFMGDHALPHDPSGQAANNRRG